MNSSPDICTAEQKIVVDQKTHRQVVFSVMNPPAIGPDNWLEFQLTSTYRYLASYSFTYLLLGQGGELNCTAQLPGLYVLRQRCPQVSLRPMQEERYHLSFL
jgi:hypothetical protein